MGWLVALGVLTGLAIFPLGIRVLFNKNGWFVRLLIGSVPITLYPVKKKEKPQKKKTDSVKSKPSAVPQKDEQKEGGSFREFLPLVRTALDFLNDLRGKLRVKQLDFKLVLAADDPCDLAVNYGRGWAVLGNLMPQLERLFVIKKRNLEVACDFTSNDTVIFARLDITITLARLLYLAVRYGLPALRQYSDIMKMRKGGAKS